MSFNKGGDGRPRGFGFSGFQLKKDKSNQLPPPPSSAISKHGYSTMSAISQNALAASYGLPRKRAKTEEEYFEEDDDNQSSPTLEYIPAPGSPSNELNKGNDSDSDEIDPLDAFMAGIEQQVKKQTTKKTDKPDEKKKGIRDDIEDEDVEESYYRYMEENPNAGVQADDSDQEIEYDEDGNPIAPKKNKTIDPLPPIDHSTIKYADFEKNFYVPHDEIAALDSAKVAELLSTLGIRVTGPDPPKPVTSFAHFGFDDLLIKKIRKSEYTQPTPIQSQAVPAALAGRDIIGIAKTGSGKTAAFIWPLLVHLMDQPILAPGDGPIGLILAPTRELSQQIYTEAKRFGKVYNVRVCCCYGGGSKWEQSKALEGGAEIVVATPGRMIDMVKMGATNLARVTFLVLDEADRMFDMGFEPQVRSICDHVRPDRQTLLFSATFKKKIEKLARDVTTDPVRIVQGDVGEANTDVTQIIKMMISPQAKFTWLLNSLVEFLSSGSVLVFVSKKANAEELANSLTLKELDVLLLHGDMDQIERNKVITKFKKNEVSTLVATDVAARGLDIPHIKTVINYDVARDVDTHTHRIGRTGRAGQRGTAYTLVTDKDKEFAGHLVRNLEGAAQEVPHDLMDLAMQSSWFRKSRFKGGRGKGAPAYRERPGLGSASGKPLGVAASSASAAVAAATAAASAAGGRTGGGPGSDRLAAMKAAFRSQYQNQFTASSDHTWEQTRETEAAAAAAAQTTNAAAAAAQTTNAAAASQTTNVAAPSQTTNVAAPSQTTNAAIFKPPEQPRKQKKSRWDSS